MQLRTTQIKLLIAIWMIGHFLYIRMCSIGTVLALGKQPESQCDVITVAQIYWAREPSHTVNAMTSAAAQRRLPLSPGGPARPSAQ